MIYFNKIDFVSSYFSILISADKFKSAFQKNSFFSNLSLVHYIKVRTKILVY